MTMLTAFTQTDPALFRTSLEIIHQDEISVGTRGQPVLSGFIVDGTIRALVRLLSQTSGTKIEIARQLVPKATHIIVTRYNALLTTRKRLRLTSGSSVRIFNIGHADNCDELNIEHQLICMEEITPDEG